MTTFVGLCDAQDKKSVLNSRASNSWCQFRGAKKLVLNKGFLCLPLPKRAAWRLHVTLHTPKKQFQLISLHL